MNTVASLPDRLRYMVADGRNMGVNERTIDLDAIEQAATLLSEHGEVTVTTDASGRCVAVTRQDGEGRILSTIWEASEHGGGGEAGVCLWSTAYGDENDMWESSCGIAFVFNDGGPEDNSFRFCHGCGKRIEVASDQATPPTQSAPAKQAESPLIGAWTDADMKKPWGLEAASLRHLADDPALNVEQSAMLRHCAKRIESTAGIQLRALADMLDPAKQAGVLRDAADALPSPSAPARTDKEQHVNAIRTLCEMGWRWKGGKWVAPAATPRGECRETEIDVACRIMQAMPELQRLLELRQYENDSDAPMAVEVETDLIDAVMYEFRDTICRVRADNAPMATATPAASDEEVPSRSRLRRIAAEKGEPAPRFDAASEDGPLLSQLQQVEDALQARDMGHEAGVVQCAIRRLAASGQGVDWRRIESAPKDETLLLLGWNGGDPAQGSHIVIGSNYHGRWLDRGMDEANRDLGNTLAYITHWMPLPAAPTQEKGNG